MDIHRLALAIYHIVQMLGTDEYVGAQFVLRRVRNGESEHLDVSLLVEFFEPVPRYAPLFDIFISLQIENTRNPSIFHFLDIILIKRIGSEKEPCVCNLVKVQSAQEICVSFIDHAIYDPDFLLVLPLDGFLSAELALVSFWLLNDHGSAWVSFLHDAGLWFVAF